MLFEANVGMFSSLEGLALDTPKNNKSFTKIIIGYIFYLCLSVVNSTLTVV